MHKMKSQSSARSVVGCAAVLALLLGVAWTCLADCTYRAASHLPSTDCSKYPGTTNISCVVISYNNLPGGATDPRGNPWSTYGDDCVDTSGYTDCNKKSMANLYMKTDSGTCQDESCAVDTYGTWVYYGPKWYYATEPCP
jgi:hypothetical protein